MAVIAVIPQTTIAAGPLKFGPGPVSSAASQFVITVVQVAWPNVGELAFDYVCDVSLDGGATWVNPPPAGGNVFDTMVPARFGRPAGQFKIACSIPGVGNANRKIRFSVVFAKSITLSGTLEAF